MKISKIAIGEILKNIEEEKLFETQDTSSGFQIKIARYAPFCCIAKLPCRITSVGMRKTHLLTISSSRCLSPLQGSIRVTNTT